MNFISAIPRTALDVFNLLPEGTRCEVIENALYMLPSLTIDHQQVLGDIAYAIHKFIEKKPSGNLFIGPLDIYLDNECSILQPDYIYKRAKSVDRSAQRDTWYS